jgi:hypothetical protein
VRTLAWDRGRVLKQIRANIWRYLTPGASIEDELLEAAALLGMHPLELRVLGRLQFLTSRELGELIHRLPFLVRRLATTTANEEEWSAERIRGAIQWGRTIGVRQATGIPNLYVTSPARRAYQTPENELLVLVLDAVVTLARHSGWHRSTSDAVGKTVSGRATEAEKWLQTRALLEVERRPMTGLKLSRIRSGRHRRRYQPVLDAFERYRLLAQVLDRTSIREAVETAGLVTRDDPRLFELLCTFRTIDALKNLGWKLSRLGLFAGSLRLKGRRGATTLELSYQSTPTPLSRGSIYRSVQHGHSLNAGPLIPDLVIRTHGPKRSRWLMIEVKAGFTRSGPDSARAAAHDLLAYRAAFAPTLGEQEGSYGLGVAYGAELLPNLGEEVVLCTPDTIELALAELVR